MINLIYPIGGGGKWLSSLIYQLLYNNRPMNNKSTINFHNGYEAIYKSLRKRGIKINHNIADSAYTSFAGTNSKFNVFINSIVKFYIPVLGYNNLKVGEQVLRYADICKFVHSEKYNECFETNIGLNYDNIYLDRFAFYKELCELLSEYDITTNYQLVDKMINEYIQLLNPYDYYRNTTVEWIGWISGLMELNNIEIPYTLANIEPKDFAGFLDFSSNFTFPDTKIIHEKA